MNHNVPRFKTLTPKSPLRQLGDFALGVIFIVFIVGLIMASPFIVGALVFLFIAFLVIMLVVTIVIGLLGALFETIFRK